jgi:hypothetical protein
LFPGPNTTVFLIDQGTRFMGTYNIDANGFIIPQFIGSENLASSQLIAGQTWLALLEIWMPGATPGQSVRQRTLRRRISHMTADVSNSTGFVFVRGYARPPTTPPANVIAAGNITGSRRIPYYYVGEDPSQPAPLREEMQRWRPIGRAFDPRMGIIKDTPGPLLVHEIGIEVTV